MAMLLAFGSIGNISASPTGTEKPFAFVALSATTIPGSVTLSWPKANLSTIYLYRDYTANSKPIATLNPTDSSYTDNITGAHNYSLMIIGRDGSVAMKSNPLPVWVPSACESSEGTVMKLWLDKTKMVTDCTESVVKTPPTIIAGSTYVSIRPIIEAAGGALLWNADTRTATVTLPPNTVALTIDNPIAKVNGQDKPISADKKLKPVIKNGSTMLPFRFIVENLGGTVGYNSDERRLDITLPLQPNKAIARIMAAYSTLAQGELGQLVDVDTVETINSQDAISEFLSGAKVLMMQNGKPVATPLLNVTDVNGRKLSNTDIKSQYSAIDGNLAAYKVNIKSRNSLLPSFSTVVLINRDSGEIADATFIASSIGFAADPNSPPSSTVLKVGMQQPIASYFCGFSGARLNAGKLEFFTESIPFTTTASGKLTTTSPGCNPCNLGRTDIYVEFRNTCPDSIDTASRLTLPLISNMFDFALNLGNSTESFGLDVAQGCAFFPSPVCTAINEAQSDMTFDVADFRPVKVDDNSRVVAQSVKGTYRLVGTQTGWKPEASNDKSKSYVTVRVPGDQRPKSIGILIGNGKGFALSALTESLYPGNPPRMLIKCPLLSNPNGKQVGILALETKTTVTVVSPFDKVGYWFSATDRKLGVFGQADFTAKSEFDCPCEGSAKIIENPNLKLEQKGDVSIVTITCRINVEAAFKKDNDKVQVQMFRDDEPLDIIAVSKSDPNVTIADKDPMAGQTYTYCIKVLINSQEAEQWCNPEPITPIQTSLSVTWANKATSFTTKVMAGEHFTIKIIITNGSESEARVNLTLRQPCKGWTGAFTNQSLSTLVTVSPNGANSTTQLTITPDITLGEGELCEFVVDAVCGKQKQAIKLKAFSQAALCVYTAQWNEGGTAIGGSTSAGVQNVQTFTVKNSGKESNRFIIDLNYDRFGTNARQLWSLRFGGDLAAGSSITLKPGESKEIQVFCKPANDMPDGEKIKISVTVEGCGEKAVLTWLMTNILSECDFNLEWEKGTMTRTMKTYPGERFFVTFVVKNKMDISNLILLTADSKGEPIETMTQYFELQMNPGDERKVKLTCTTDQKAKIGQTKVNVHATCGRSSKTISLTVTIGKQEECAYDISWDSTETNATSSDMPIDEKVFANVRIKNKSLTDQYFAVKVERSIEEWISGISEDGLLKQTFTLKPGEETTGLLIFAQAGKGTQVGEKCMITVSIKACNTSQVIKWEVTSVPHQDLDANFTCKSSGPSWTNDDRLLIPCAINYTRQGVGLIKADEYWFEFFDADNFDASLGKLDKLPLDTPVTLNMTPWTCNLKIPAAAISKAQAMNSKNIKVVMYVTFTMEKDKKETIVNKSIAFNVPIPAK